MNKERKEAMKKETRKALSEEVGTNPTKRRQTGQRYRYNKSGQLRFGN